MRNLRKANGGFGWPRFWIRRYQRGGAVLWVEIRKYTLRQAKALRTGRRVWDV